MSRFAWCSSRRLHPFCFFEPPGCHFLTRKKKTFLGYESPSPLLLTVHTHLVTRRASTHFASPTVKMPKAARGKADAEHDDAMMADDDVRTRRSFRKNPHNPAYSPINRRRLDTHTNLSDLRPAPHLRNTGVRGRASRRRGRRRGGIGGALIACTRDRGGGPCHPQPISLHSS
jgi:hypothetical protein